MIAKLLRLKRKNKDNETNMSTRTPPDLSIEEQIDNVPTDVEIEDIGQEPVTCPLPAVPN